jgi:hypothetical protein
MYITIEFFDGYLHYQHWDGKQYENLEKIID